MTTKAHETSDDTGGLPAVGRAESIERLSPSFDTTSDSEVDGMWREEIESRFSAYDQGKPPASPAEEVLGRISRR